MDFIDVLLKCTPSTGVTQCATQFQRSSVVILKGLWHRYLMKTQLWVCLVIILCFLKFVLHCCFLFHNTLIAYIYNKTCNSFSIGKKYVFDIQRTCREAYDHARRVLYQAENSLSLPNTPVHRQETREHNSLVDGQTTEKGNANIQEECQVMCIISYVLDLSRHFK